MTAPPSPVLRSFVIGKDRDEALAAFWAYHRAYPGNRRSPPEHWLKVKQIRKVPGSAGLWAVLYTPAARVLKDIHSRAGAT